MLLQVVMSSRFVKAQEYEISEIIDNPFPESTTL